MNNHIPALLAGILILSSALAAQAAELSQNRPDAETLSELPTTDWLTNGGDLFNRNFSALTEINTENVDQLGPVWRTHLEESGVGAKYSGEAQPIVHDGVMYIITGADDVFALDVETGRSCGATRLISRTRFRRSVVDGPVAGWVLEKTRSL